MSYKSFTLDDKMYYYNKIWSKKIINNEICFVSDGKTKWQHLLIKLPQELKRDCEYFIKIIVKFKTDKSFITLKVQNDDKSFQELCRIEKCDESEIYNESVCILCENDFQYLRVTSDEFVGDNYFQIIDLVVEKISKKHRIKPSVNEIILKLAQYSESTSGYGSLFEYLHDIGVDTISVFYLDDTLMSSMHAIAWESGIHIHSDICLNNIQSRIGTTTFYSVTPDELINSSEYNKNIPIVCCGNVDWYIRKNKLEKITSKIYDFNSLYNYAVVKNCVIDPVYSYLQSHKILSKIVHMKLVRVFDIDNPTENEKRLQKYNYDIDKNLVYDFDVDYKAKSNKCWGPFWRGTGKKLEYIEVSNEYCMAMNGVRRTFYQNKDPEINIWFIGVSVSSGSGHVIDEL